MTNRKSYSYNSMVPLWTLWGDPLIRVMGTNLGKPLISLKLIELRRSNLTVW